MTSRNALPSYTPPAGEALLIRTAMQTVRGMPTHTQLAATADQETLVKNISQSEREIAYAFDDQERALMHARILLIYAAGLITRLDPDSAIPGRANT